MRSITWILQLSRLFVAMTLMVGPACPAYAGFTGASPSSGKDAAAVRPSGTKTAQVRSAAGLKIPLYFEANGGQTDASVKFFTRAGGYNLYLTGTEAVMVIPKAAAAGKESDVLRMKLKGANAKPAVQGLEVLPGRTSYFLGNDRSKWQVGVKQYAKVKLAQVYPGIDMVYRFDKGNVEYDFVVAPGANPWRILLGFEGAKGLRLDAKGNLVLRTDSGELTYKAPQLYQTLGSKRVSVKGRFVLASNNNVRFEVGNYVKSKALVIDPKIVYGTYLGGSVDDQITSIQVDGLGQAYVTGWANSAMTGTSGFQTPASALSAPGPDNGASDVFVAKLSDDGVSLLWLAWLGGALNDQANSLALEKSPLVAGEPKVYITGFTRSVAPGLTYPVAGFAMQTCDINPAPGSLAFVTELSQPSNIPALVYSTCWGDSLITKDTVGNSIAVDSLGAAYVTGSTLGDSNSVALSMPITLAHKFPIIGPDPGVGTDPYGWRQTADQGGFVMKISIGGTSGVEYSMFLGPQSGITGPNAIAVDAAGKAWVAGTTASDTWPATPLAGHFATSRIAASDAFVAQVNAAGTGLDYMTYINGNTNSEATAIALNKGGAAGYNVFVAGWTMATTIDSFPSTAYCALPTSGPGSRGPVWQKDPQGSGDPFILRLNPDGTGVQEMVYATRVGSTDGLDKAYALALDSRDDAYISGWTEGAAGWGALTTHIPLDPLTDCTSPCVSRGITGAEMTNTSGVGVKDAFVAAISADGFSRPFFTFLGASDASPVAQQATGIAIDANHNIYVAGFTGAAGFPTTTGSLNDGLDGSTFHGVNRDGIGGAFDGFVMKIAPVVLFGAPLSADSIPPTITITQPVDGSYINQTSTTVVITFADGDSGISTSTLFVELDGNTITSGITVYASSSATVQLTGLTEGHHHLDATIRDLATNQASAVQKGFTVALDAAVCRGEFFYPSPATGATGTFEYCMDRPGTAKIRVYNVVGDIAAKIEDVKAAGVQRSTINTARLAPGVYLYRLEKSYDNATSSTSSVKKFVVKH